MADATAAFALTLEDALSPGAKSGKASLSALETELKNAKTALSGYQSQLSLAKDLGDVEGYKKYSALVDGAKRSVFDLAAQAEAAGPGLASAGAAAGTMAMGLGLVTAAAGVAIGALGGLVSVLKFGVITALEEANEKARFLAGFEALGGTGAGEKTMKMLDELGAKLPQSEADLVKWTKNLQAMGITDLSKIRGQLIATASAQAIMGDEGAAAYTKLQQRVQLAVEAHHGLKLAEKSLTALYKAGINETEVAKRMGLTTQELGAKLKAGTIDAQKFGDALSASVTAKGKGSLDSQMSSLESIGKRAHKVFGDLFEDVGTKPLTDGLRSVIELLDKGTPSGEAMGKGITGGLNAVFRVLGSGITEAEVFFLTLELYALKGYVAMKPLIGVAEKIGKGLSMGADLLGAGAGAAGGALGVPKTDQAAASKEGQIAAAEVVLGFGTGLPQMVDFFATVIGSLADAKALEVARAGGEKAGKAALEGIKTGVEAHSPSRAAARIGLDVGAGLGGGMEDSPAPARAARTISGNALGGLAGGAANGNGGAAAGGATSNVFHITINAPDGVTDAKELSMVGLATAFERFQIGSGR